MRRVIYIFSGMYLLVGIAGGGFEARKSMKTGDLLRSFLVKDHRVERLKDLGGVLAQGVGIKIGDDRDLQSLVGPFTLSPSMNPIQVALVSKNKFPTGEGIPVADMRLLLIDVGGNVVWEYGQGRHQKQSGFQKGPRG